MAGRTVHLRIGGQTYRVVTSASDDELQRLAAVVDQKLSAVVPAGRTVTPQAMLLAAMALAHELEEERGRSEAVRTQARGAFGRMLERVDAALGAAPELAPVDGSVPVGETPARPVPPAETARPPARPVPLGETAKPLARPVPSGETAKPVAPKPPARQVTAGAGSRLAPMGVPGGRPANES